MAVDRWFIGGGAEHTPEAARRAVYASTGGAEGVGGVNDLRVRPLAVPGQGVRVAVGSALIRSRYVGGETQTYMGTVTTQETVTITPTGSGSGRTDLIVMQIEDPFAAGSTTTPPSSGNIPNAPYVHIRVISGVPSGAKRLQDIAAYANRTAVTLARVNIPASTGTVTAAMITDLRKVAQPQVIRNMILRFPTGAFAEGRRMSSSSYSDWPLVDGERPLLDIPEWASVLKVSAHIEGAWYAKTSSETNAMVAATRVGIGPTPVVSEHGIVTKFATDTGGRSSHAIIGQLKIPEALRGTTQPLRLQAHVTSAATTGSLFADYQSTVSIDYEFSEEA